MPFPLYEFLTWSGWRHLGTVALLLSSLPAIVLPFVYARTGNWRVSLASRSLMWLYAGIAGVFVYFDANAAIGVAWPGRDLLRFVVFMPLGYGVWRMWVTHVRYRLRNGRPQRITEEFQPTADEKGH